MKITTGKEGFTNEQDFRTVAFFNCSAPAP